MKPRPRRGGGPISARLLAFNLLLVFLPVAGFLALDTYERQLLRALEHALVQQARVLASALSGTGAIDAGQARRILRELARRHEARLRVVDASGRLLADSSRPDAAAGQPAAQAGPVESPASERALYRIASFPIRLYRTLRPPQPALESSEFYGGAAVLQGAEVREALAGRYGAATRISSGGQRSVTLYSAIPVWGGEEGAAGRPVAGAALASQSTYRILGDLYELRLDVFRIFVGSVAAAVAISLVVSTTITGPLRRLRERALVILGHKGRPAGHFQAMRRGDEIGDLSRALEALTRKQEEHLRSLESFAADLSHELRNPLASVRSAAEAAQQAEEAEEAERGRFLEMIRRDTARMERLLADVREISRVDARLAGEERVPVDAAEVARQVLEVLPMSAAAPTVDLRLHAGDGAVVNACADRLVQVLEKLIENAVSFSPPGAAVDVTVLRGGAWVVLRVEDRGPGVPPALRERIFDRFFTWRPAGADGGHSGLGLALVRSILRGYGGDVAVSDRPGGGACFEARLPAAAVAAASVDPRRPCR